MRRYRRPNSEAALRGDQWAASLRGIEWMVEGLQTMRPRSQHIRRPPNRFLFGGWTYAGRLNRDIGKFPGFGRLPRPPCAARTLNDRDEGDYSRADRAGDGRG